MKREYFCANCSLYYWEEYPSAPICPNKECPSHHSEEGQHRYACDTIGFSYFVQNNEKQMKETEWTSEQYVGKELIDKYKENGVIIK